jgi:peptide deformylase
MMQAKTAVAKFDIAIDPPSIHKMSVDFDFSNPQRDPVQFAYDLVDTMVAKAGLGLAAPQVGLNYRVIAIRGEPMLVMFNPKIVGTSSDLIVLEEGCLSFPGVYVDIKRPSTLRVRYTEPNGNIRTEKFEGLSARIIQHEIDHIDGITMLDRAHPIHREKALRKFKQMKRKIK